MVREPGWRFGEKERAGGVHRKSTSVDDRHG
jgi:hypothetical protein